MALVGRWEATARARRCQLPNAKRPTVSATRNTPRTLHMTRCERPLFLRARPRTRRNAPGPRRYRAGLDRFRAVEGLLGSKAAPQGSAVLSTTGMQLALRRCAKRTIFRTPTVDLSRSAQDESAVRGWPRMAIEPSQCGWSYISDHLVRETSPPECRTPRRELVRANLRNPPRDRSGS